MIWDENHFNDVNDYNATLFKITYFLISNITVKCVTTFC